MTHAAQTLMGAFCVLLLGASDAVAQHAYPAKGQGPQRQAKDEAECSRWATEKTGFDPSRPPQVATTEPEKVTGSGSRAKGALVGAGLGAIGGNAGAGAAAGAIAGGIHRRAKNRRAADAQNQAHAQQMQAANASYLQARSSCLSGRGYSVK